MASEHPDTNQTKGVKPMKLNLIIKIIIVYAMTVAVRLRFRKGP